MSLQPTFDGRVNMPNPADGAWTWSSFRLSFNHKKGGTLETDPSSDPLLKVFFVFKLLVG